jgi:hypothetical protein
VILPLGCVKYVTDGCCPSHCSASMDADCIS